MGFKNAETQTLVSSRTTSGTAFRFNLGPGSTDFDLDGLLRDCFGSRPHSAQKALKIAAPLSLGTQGNRDARFFPQPERLQRSKNAVFIDRLKGFLRRDSFLKQCHKKDYNDDPTLGSIAMEKTTVKNAITRVALGGALLLALSPQAQAQQPGKVPRIGYVSGAGDPSDPGPAVEAFRQGLRDRGYIEGKNILVEYRYAEGRQDRVSSLVSELLQLKVDVLVLLTLPSVRAAKAATNTIPIVMVLAVDPVATGIVDSLARPGGNITGLATLQRELSGKRLELLKEVVPATVARWSFAGCGGAWVSSWF